MCINCSTATAISGLEGFEARNLDRAYPGRPDGNWRLLPPRAVETLALEEATAR